MATARDKALPFTPSSFDQLHQVNIQLHDRNKFLEEVIEILYIQNQQYSAITQHRKVHGREQRLKVERVMKALKDLHETQSRHQQTMKELEDDRKQHWDDFCDQKTADAGEDVWSYLETVKEKIMDSQYEELILGAQTEEVPVKMMQQDLR